MTTKVETEELFQIDYEIRRPVDEHPTGPRVRSLFAASPEAARRKLAALYDVKDGGDYLRIDRVRNMSRRTVEYDRYGWGF